MKRPTSDRRPGRLQLTGFAVATVVLFFVLVEALLWIAGVRPLMAERDPFRGFSGSVQVYELDPDRGVWRTPPRSVVHSFNYQEFAAEKSPNGFRMFTLGGSSAYGFPWGARVAFTRLVGEGLAAALPDRTVEAVNAAAMSYGSHRLRILAAELVEHQPDVLVVYGGHNEFVERRFYRELLERPEQLDTLRRVLYRTRLYSGLTRLYERNAAAGGGRDQQPGERSTGELLGLDVYREYTVDVGPEEMAEARRTFHENLTALVRLVRERGIPLVLCTVPSNLRDWRPNQSAFAATVEPSNRRRVTEGLAAAERLVGGGRSEQAIEVLEQARDLAPGYAATHFALGRTYESVGRWSAARRSFEAARDLDAQPSRAPTAFNETLRQIAREQHVMLVDAERLLADASPHGVPGFDLFEDYVHPKPIAHRLIARVLGRRLLESDVTGSRRPTDATLFDTALAAASDIAADGSAETPALLLNLALVLENQGSVDQAIEKYHECLELEPRYYFARLNLGRLLHRRGRFAEALAEFQLALPDATNDSHRVRALVGMGEALQRLEQLVPAIEAFERACAVDPRSAVAWRNLGEALAQHGRHTDAIEALERAAAIEDGGGVRANLGFAYLALRRLDEAESSFRRAIDLLPEARRGHNGLAAVLADRGDLPGAERIFRESLRLDPDDAFARGGLELIQQRRTQ